MSTDQARIPTYGIVLLISLGLFWGLNWPGMKIALNEITVWWFRVLSVTAGGLGLLTLAALTGRRLIPTRAEIGPLMLCALFGMMGWHVFTAYGVSQMPAGRASIIAFTMPVWAAVLSTVLLNERMTVYKIAGLVLGIAGLAVLMGPDIIVLQTAPVGALFMLCAAMSWAIGTVLFKRFAFELPVITNVGWQLTMAAVAITIIAVLVEPVPDLTTLSTDAILALAYLFAIPMIYCQWAFLMAVRLMPAAVASIGTLAVPIVGVFSSALILGEAVGWREVTAMALIVTALTVVLVLPAVTARHTKH